ncbi:MAG: tartrate dehydrogenase, partial [Selenomonas sp.]|nr:tartrate dehydrogenase [Selenomonas sp.]
IAGQGLANPLAAIWSVSQMLDFFGQETWGKKVINAIETLLLEKKTLTPDLGGTAKTSDIGGAILEILQR